MPTVAEAIIRASLEWFLLFLVWLVAPNGCSVRAQCKKQTNQV
jgi:hypothetical protein